MLALIASAMLAPAVTVPLDAVKLFRTFKAGETEVYQVHANIDSGGNVGEVDAEVVFKIQKADDKVAQVSMTTRKFTMKMGGSPQEHALPEEIVTEFDGLGMPHAMNTDNESWVYILASLSGLVPAREVEVGSGFDIKWVSKDETIKATGKGKAVEIADFEGVKAVKLQYELEVAPHGEAPGTLKYTSHLAKDGTVPISCEGSVSVAGDAEIKFTVKKIKG